MIGEHVERRVAPPRPTVEHLLALADDLVEAGRMQMSSVPLQALGGAALESVARQQLRNLYAALPERRR